MPTSTLPPGTPDVDLTASGNSGVINDAVFATGDFQSSGTGVFNPFLQIQHNGTEQGYNTDASHKQFNESNSHTHALLLANVPIVIGDGTHGTVEGLTYREFRLDLNEKGGGKQFLSLDKLQIWQEESGGLSNFTSGAGFAGAHTNYLAYDLDAGADHWVALNDGLSHGSGQSDVVVLIPDSVFINDASHRYVYLYSGFGYQSGWASDGGFEEWGVSTPAGAPGTTSALSVSKSATVPGGTADTAGEAITYSIKVSNVGDANLTGITVTDPSVSDMTGVDANHDGFNDGDTNHDNILNAGEVWSYTAHHTVTQADIDNNGNGDGVITNTVTADSLQTNPSTATAAVTVDRHPHLTLVKEASVPGGTADAAGEVISYAISVTNDGNTTLTNPVVSDLTVVPVLNHSAPIVDPAVQVFIPVNDGDFNLGDTNQNNVQDPGETFQYVYPGDTNADGFHDPGETWAAFNLGDTNQNNIHEAGETWVGDTNQNGIEEAGERWQFQNLGDVNHDNLQNNGETWQYANAGDTNLNGMQDPGETFLYRNVGDTNQNGVEDPGETFQYYNAGDTNQNGIEDPGETFQFTTVAQPLSGVDANNDGFNDGDTNQDGKLSVGETWQYTTTHTVTQDEIDNRNANGVPTVDPTLTHDNTASAQTDQTDPVTASASVPIEQKPHVELVKNAAVQDGVVDQAGDVIHYRITATNDGNMTLTNPMVSDPSVTDLAGVDANHDGFNDGDSNHDGELSVGETWKYTASYTATQADIDNGGVVNPDLTHDNTASVTTDQGATASDGASVPIQQNPHVTLVKDATVPGGTADHAGELISYAITVTNDGNMTLTNPVVSDSFASNLHGLDLNEDGFNDGDANHDGKVSVGETWQYTANHVVTQAEMDAGGSISNTASVTTDQGATSSDGASVPVEQHANLTLDKSGVYTDTNGDNIFDQGDTIDYTFLVTNDGNLTLHDVAVNDPLLGGPLSGPDSGDVNHAGFLDVGETWTYHAAYTVREEDQPAGFVHNDATATALGPQDQAASATASADVPPPNQNPEFFAWHQFG
jgi:uncharacterized repeat protein (TIGR01451 family)